MKGTKEDYDAYLAAHNAWQRVSAEYFALIANYHQADSVGNERAQKLVPEMNELYADMMRKSQAVIPPS